ncbi:MAG: replicative DNA helicase [Treponema sp.]|jgi:replicative DNA helicase|nr:replicative DNA helicase [Treponema sp.]
MAAPDRKSRMPPHNDEAERALLGGLLADPDAVGEVLQYLRPRDFYSGANGRVYEAILSLDGRGLKPDLMTAIQELKQSGKLDETGGAAYVASLTTVIPSSANIEYYAKTIQGYSLRRSLLRVAGEINAKAFDESIESRVVLEEIEQRIFELGENRQGSSAKSIGEILKRAIEVIDRVYKSKKEYTGIPSGFDALDKMTTGFQNSEFIVIGARPSIGKTALALSMAASISIRSHIPVGFFTLEMSDLALTHRLISSEAMIESNALRTGFIKTSDFQRILDASGNIYVAPLYIVDMPNMKLLDLRSQARKLRAQQQVQIIFIDYLGLIDFENNFIPRYEQISAISRSLKSLARELDIPIVVLCQLTREAEKTQPNLANLRDSGSIEQDADLVMFLHRERVQQKDDEKNQGKEDGLPTDLIIAKQRNGPVGTVKLALLSKFAKFVPLVKN